MYNRFIVRVFAMRTLLPARTYSLWISSTVSGLVRLHSPPPPHFRFSSSVPMAPSRISGSDDLISSSRLICCPFQLESPAAVRATSLKPTRGPGIGQVAGQTDTMNLPIRTS